MGDIAMDREKMLDYLKRMADGISEMFGSNCEVVIHDMENYESSILYITNDHVTQRSVGEQFNVLGTKELDSLYEGTDLINHKGTAKNNHLIKSSTFHLKGDDYHFALGINYDYTNMLLVQSSINDLISVSGNIDVAVKEDVNLEIKLTDLFESAVEHIGKPLPFMRKNDRVEMIRFLNEKGAFSIHKGIPIIADKMNISRYTIYNYLREIKGE